MVTILEEMIPNKDAIRVSLTVDNAFIFPIKWLFYHYKLGNLTLRKTVSQIRSEKRMTDQILIEMLSEFNFREDLCDYDYNFIINSWSKDKQWRGVVPTQNGTTMVEVKVQNKVVLTTLYNGVYEISTENEIYCRCDARSEFKYNQDMLNYFGSKFPIELKSLAPINGEDNAILG